MLKRKYADWGAPYILAILAERYPTQELPQVGTVQLWFRKAGLNKARTKRPQPKRVPVEAVHDVWQIDAKENVGLQDGSYNSYLTIVDVKSGVALATPVFPPEADM